MRLGIYKHFVENAQSPSLPAYFAASWFPVCSKPGLADRLSSHSSLLVYDHNMFGLWLLSDPL